MHVSDYFSKIISFGLWLPAVQPCNWVGFRISLSREGAIFRDEIENYFSCSHLARRDRDYHMTILVFRDENEITYCYSRVSRRDRDFTKSFLMVEREKMKLTLTRIPGIENSRWTLLSALFTPVTLVTHVCSTQLAQSAAVSMCSISTSSSFWNLFLFLKILEEGVLKKHPLWTNQHDLTMPLLNKHA